MKTTIYLEALSLAKEKILQHLKGKAGLIKFLYNKPEITEADVKRIHTEEDHIRQVLAFVDDSETTITAIQEENQQLRLKCETLEAQKLVLFNSAAFWKQEYHKEQQNYLQLVDAFIKIQENKNAA